MKSIERRLEALEGSKPRTISTLADLVIYAASDSDEEVELSPQMQELVDKLEEGAVGV